ncbi:MAG: peptidoglycan-binding domain-containing protein [Micavibrio sp.]
MKKIFYAMLLTTALTLPAAGALAQGELITRSSTSTGGSVTTSVGDSTLMRGEILDTTTLTELQRALMARGYNPGRVDGVWGPRTAEALRNFHMDNGAATMQSGHLSSNTLTQLGIDSNANADVTGSANLDSTIDSTGSTSAIEPSAGVGTTTDNTVGGAQTMDNGISGSGTMDMGVDGPHTMDMDGRMNMDSTTGSSTNNSTSGATTGSTGGGSFGNP